MSDESAKPLPRALARVLRAYEHHALDDELRRLIGVHGRETVRDRAKELTKSKRGRKPEPDWELLWPIIKRDAQLWLDGNETELRKRTNYKVAQTLAAEVPGHNPTATHRRIARKLAKKRQLFMLVAAVEESRAGYPFAAHFRSLQALNDCSGHRVWGGILASRQAELEKYRERMGDPDPALSLAAIEEANRNAPTLLPAADGLGGLLGMFATSGNALQALRKR